MKKFVGFQDLFYSYKDLPDVGWIYLEKGTDSASDSAIRSAVFFIAEDEDEEIEFDAEYDTWLECPIFQDIIKNKKTYSPTSGLADFIAATIYYLERDDFMD